MASNLGGRKPSSSLFREWNTGDNECEPIYSLSEFKKIFLEERDLTEYKAAIRCIGDWQEWNRLKRDSLVFNNTVNEWIEELKILLTSEAQEKILGLIDSDKEQIRLSAAKWLAEHGFNRKDRGRPSKRDIELEKERLAKESCTSVDELNRVKEALSVKEVHESRQ